MTEEEWLECEDHKPMVRFLSRQISDRKFRLIECACCRRIWHLLTDERSRKAVELAERAVDERVSSVELTKAYLEAEAAFQVLRHEYFADRGVPRSYYGGRVSAAQSAAHLVWADEPFRNIQNIIWIATACHPLDGEEIEDNRASGSAIWTELAAYPSLLRHIIGNPFRPFQGPASWPASVVKLAQSAYDQQPVSFALHDALLDCGQVDLAEHFKESYHPKGCWVLDMILGKS